MTFKLNENVTPLKNFISKKEAALKTSSIFYNVPAKQTRSVLTAKPFDFVSMSNFINGFCRTFSINKSRSGFCKSLVDIVILHIFIIRMCDSHFSRYVCQNSIFVQIPQFILIYIMKLTLCCESENKSTGWTKGEVKTPLTLQELLFKYQKIFLGKEWSTIFIDTPFSEVLVNKYDEKKFLKLLEIRINTYLAILKESDSVDDEFDIILNFLSGLPEILYDSNSMEMFKGRLPHYVSPHLGIFRFRNSSIDDIYYVSQNTCTQLGIDTVEYYAMFLKLFKPTCTQGPDLDKVTSFLPGDAEFNLEHTPEFECWLKFFSYTVIPSGTEKSKPKVKRKGTKNTSSSGSSTNHVLSTADNSTIIDKMSIDFDKHIIAYGPDLIGHFVFTSAYESSTSLYRFFPAESYDIDLFG